VTAVSVKQSFMHSSSLWRSQSPRLTTLIKVACDSDTHVWSNLDGRVTAISRQQPCAPLITITMLGGRRPTVRPSRGVGGGWYNTQQKSLVDAAAVTVEFNCQRRVFIIYLISGGLLMVVAPGVSVHARLPSHHSSINSL